MNIHELASNHRDLFRVKPNKLQTFLEQQPHLTPEHVMEVYKIGSELFKKKQWKIKKQQ